LAFHSYHDTRGRLPPGYINATSNGDLPPPDPRAPVVDQFNVTEFSKLRDPGWDWAAIILPHLEQGNLARQIRYDLPVGDPSNEAARRVNLAIYTCPSDSSTGDYTVQQLDARPLCYASTSSYAGNFGGNNNYLGTSPFRGDGLLFENSQVRLEHISDGLSNTFIVGERAALLARAPWAGAITHGTVRTTLGAPTYTRM